MCGIIGIIAKEPVANGLLEGLRRLEYRGYDSAGIATLVNGRIECRRAEGKLVNLARRLDREPVQGVIGIGHTRWTETDTEAVAILATHFLAKGLSPRNAVAKTLARLEGAFALAFLFAGEHDLLIGARRGSPLAIGYGDGEMFLGSDALALAPLTRRLTYLEEGDWAVVTSRAVTIFDRANHKVGRAVRETALSGALISPVSRTVNLPELPFALGDLGKITTIACGTAHHAGMIAKYWLEGIARA